MLAQFQRPPAALRDISKVRVGDGSNHVMEVLGKPNYVYGSLWVYGRKLSISKINIWIDEHGKVEEIEIDL